MELKNKKVLSGDDDTWILVLKRLIELNIIEAFYPKKPGANINNIFLVLEKFAKYDHYFLQQERGTTNGIKDIAIIRVIYFAVVMAYLYFDNSLSTQDQKIRKITMKFSMKNASAIMIEKLKQHFANRIKSLKINY